MRTLSSFGLLGATLLSVVAVACGSSSNSAGSGDAGPSSTAAPTACTTAQECNSDECVCTDGETVETGSICLGGSCTASGHESFCATSCQMHGGVSAIRPHPNVATSAECDAWCNKGAALACGATTCDRFFFCGVPKGSCEAATQAALECAAEKGVWACSQHSNAWSVRSSCPTFAELCTGADAGTD